MRMEKSIVKTKILAIVVSEFLNDASKTVDSLMHQTIEPYIEVLTKVDYPVPKEYKYKMIGEKVGYTINKFLGGVELDNFDYILKCDNDIIFPPTFLESNINTYDIQGYGSGLLIKTKAFKDIGGKWFISIIDDNLLYKAMKINGFTVYPWNYARIKPILLKESKRSIKREFLIGKAIKENNLHLNYILLFRILGYYYQVLRKNKKYVR